MTKSKLTQADKESIIKLFNEGVPKRDIAKQYNLSEQRIGDLIYDIENYGKLRSLSELTEDDWVKIIDLANKGYSCADIGAMYSVHKKRLSNKLSQMGVNLSSRRKNKETKKEVKTSKKEEACSLDEYIEQRFAAEMQSVDTFMSSIDANLLSDTSSKMYYELMSSRTQLLEIYRQCHYGIMEYTNKAIQTAGVIQSDIENTINNLTATKANLSNMLSTLNN